MTLRSITERIPNWPKAWVLLGDSLREEKRLSVYIKALDAMSFPVSFPGYLPENIEFISLSFVIFYTMISVRLFLSSLSVCVPPSAALFPRVSVDCVLRGVMTTTGAISLYVWRILHRKSGALYQ